MTGINKKKRLYGGAILSLFLFAVVMLLTSFAWKDDSFYRLLCAVSFVTGLVSIYSLYDCKEFSEQYYGKWLCGIVASFVSWIFCLTSGSMMLNVFARLENSEWVCNFIAIVWRFVLPFFVTGLVLLESMFVTIISAD